MKSNMAIALVLALLIPAAFGLPIMSGGMHSSGNAGTNATDAWINAEFKITGNASVSSNEMPQKFNIIRTKAGSVFRISIKSGSGNWTPHYDKSVIELANQSTTQGESAISNSPGETFIFKALKAGETWLVFSHDKINSSKAEKKYLVIVSGNTAKQFRAIPNRRIPHGNRTIKYGVRKPAPIAEEPIDARSIRAMIKQRISSIRKAGSGRHPVAAGIRYGIANRRAVIQYKKARAFYISARERYEEARTRWEMAKHSRNETEKLEIAKQYSEHAGEAMEGFIEKTISRIQNSALDNETKNELISELEGYEATIEESMEKIENAISLPQVREAARNMTKAWRDARKVLKKSLLIGSAAKLHGYVTKAQVAEARLGKWIERLKTAGADTTKLEAMMNEYKAHVKAAKTHIENAENEYKNNMTEQAEADIKQAYRELGDAYRILKNAVNELRGLWTSSRISMNLHGNTSKTQPENSTEQ